jgi:DNA adenine methylase
VTAKIVYSQYGGKSTLAKWIVSHFPEHRVYLEPFCGSCAVLLAKPPSFVEIVNDLDRRIISMFDVLRQRPWELAAILWATPFSPENWRQAKSSEDALEEARLLIAEGTQFYCGDGNHSTWASGSAAPCKPKPEVWADWSRRILPFAARLKPVQIMCEDAIVCVARVAADPGALIYVDPPYLGRERAYRHRVDMVALVDALRGCRAKVIVSGFVESVALFPGWHTVQKQVAGRARTGAHKRASKKNVEYLIANFPLSARR